MNKAIRIALSLFLILGNFKFALAETASLLPNAVQQYFDNNGNPISSGKVYFYTPSTLSTKTVWQDAAETTPWANPVTLNAAGRPSGDQAIYGFGSYRQIVKDKNNNTIWDRVTSSTGSGGDTPSLVGDGQQVGSIKPWAGFTAPAQYAFAYGQELSRSTYSVLFTAITQSLNVICTSFSNTLTGLSDTSQIKENSPVELICVPAGTTVVSKTTSTIVLSNPSSVSVNAIGVFFPFGNGNGTNTFNVPDLRDVVIAGRSNMGGSARGLLTTAFFGVNPSAQGAVATLQSTTLTTGNLPPYTPVVTINDPGHSHIEQGGNSGGGISFIRSDALAGSVATTSVTSSAFTNITATGTAQGGTSTAFSRIQPTVTLNIIIKILPDVSSSIATGVASLGGMTGVITCGTGLLCTGNDISVSATSPVISVFGRSGVVVAASGDYTVAQITGAAPLASPTFTGIPAAPTAASGTNTTQLATTSFVATSFAPLGSPNLTGSPTAPTAGAGTNTTQLATTAFVTTADNLKANIASPTLTGVPAAPTASLGTNTTQIATTAFVQAAASVSGVPSYDTVAAATAATIASTPIIYLRGYLAAGDRGGGFWTRSASSPGHTAIFNSADGAFWSPSLVNTAFPFEIFGATCNGGSGFDNTPALNKYNSFITAIGQLRLLFSGCIYYFNTQPISFNPIAPNVKGLGVNGTVLLINANSISLFIMQGAGGAIFEDLTIEATSGVSSTIALQWSATSSNGSSGSFLKDISVAPLGTNNLSYSINMDGSLKTVGSPGTRDHQWSAVTSFGASTASIRLYDVEGLTHIGGGLYSAGGSGAQSGGIIFDGTVTNTGSNNIQVLVNTLGAISFDRCTYCIARSGVLTAGVNNTSNTNFSGVGGRVVGTAQTNWINSNYLAF